MNDAREGIVRLSLPDGRVIPLQLTYAALDARGHGWMLDQFKMVQSSKAGAERAMADLLEVLSDGGVTANEIMSGPVHAFPLGHCLKSALKAWEIAQYGPHGRSADEAPANPLRPPRRTLWSMLITRRSASAYLTKSSGPRRPTT